MKKSKLLCLFLLAVLLFDLLSLPAFATDAMAEEASASAAAASASAAASSASTSGSAESMESFSVDAKAALLIDLNSGRTLYEQNADEKVYPASLTKIMTCLLALENGNLSDVVTVSESALSGLDPSSSTAGLVAGEKMTLENILYCMHRHLLSEIERDQRKLCRLSRKKSHSEEIRSIFPRNGPLVEDASAFRLRMTDCIIFSPVVFPCSHARCARAHRRAAAAPQSGICAPAQL